MPVNHRDPRDRGTVRLALAIALSLALLGAGCLGNAAPEDPSTDSTDTDEDSGREAEPASEGDVQDAAPIQREHEDKAIVGAPLFDPDHSTGAKATFAKTGYENGANGTWLLGYEVALTDDHERLDVETAAGGGNLPDYDLFVFGPDGGVVADSATSGADEGVRVPDVQAGTYLALVYFFVGADDPVTTTITAE